MFTLGVCISTIRPELWESLASNLSTSSVDFEIVLVGPLKKVSPPKNSKFIYSEDCPAKCYHTAIMSCDAEYILSISDDCRFEPEDALDRLVEDIKKYPSPSMVSPLYIKKNRRKPLPKQNFAPFNKVRCWNPMMPVGLLMSKQLYIDMEGIDRRFKTLRWDLDIAMRIYEKGGKVYINNDVSLFEVAPGMLCGSRVARIDDCFLRSLWCTGKKNRWKIHNKRKEKVYPF